jgi:hypothetical protein
MAKKKAKKAMAREAPKAKPSGNRGLVVGVIVAAVVIIILILLLRGKEAAPPVPTGPEAPAAPTEPARKTVELAPTPEFNTKCTSADKRTAVTLSYVPGTCTTADGSLTFTMKNPSRTAEVEGVYFEATSTSGKKSYVINNIVVSPGESIDYTISLSDLATAIGETVTDFIVYPSQAGLACLNSRSIVIKQQSCV